MSARANALTLRSDLDGPQLLRALNGLSPAIFFRAAARVPDDFRPRRARERWYRYFEPHRPEGAGVWVENATLLTGRLDARSFGRGLPPDRPTWRNVDSWEIRDEGDWMVLDVRAESFVWGMVRKMISALRGLASGEITRKEVERAVTGGPRLSLPLAEPERLVLWEVVYPRPWEFHSPGRPPRQLARDRTELERARVRAEVLRRLSDGAA